MKRTIIILTLFISGLLNSQNDSINRGVTHSITFGLDVANTLWGGTVNSRAMNFQLGYLLKDNPTNVEVGLGYERFEKLNFEFTTMTFAKVFEPLKNIELVGGFEHGVIHRWRGYLYAENNTGEYFYTYGGNAEIRYKVTRTVWLFVQFNILKRSDIGGKWAGNNTLNLKIDL